MILVTGGTGLVGSHLLYFLLQENKEIRAIFRKNSNLLAVKNIFSLYTDNVEENFQRIDWVEADVIDIPALKQAFKGISRVYHCAAFIDFDPAKYTALKKINVEGTENIINFSLANSVEKLCYVSSVATFGKSIGQKLISETSYWNPAEKNSVYAIAKYGAEMEVWRGTQEGLDAVIVNPGIILGTSPHKEGSNILIEFGAKGIPYYPSGGMGIVDVRDVVKAMILLMNSNIKNEQYILVAENISYRKILSQFATIFGKKPPTKKLPKGIMFFISNLDWIGNKIFGIKRRFVRSNIRSMYKKSYYDNSKIIKELNFQFTPLEETLKSLANKYQKK